MIFLAQNTPSELNSATGNANNIFGKIKPPQGLEGFAQNPTEAASRLLTVGIRLFFIFAGVTALVWMMRGAFDWITSGGDKEKVAAAQQKVYNAVVGTLLLVAVLAIVATLEQLVFDGKFCFGLTCAIELPRVGK